MKQIYYDIKTIIGQVGDAEEILNKAKCELDSTFKKYWKHKGFNGEYSYFNYQDNEEDLILTGYKPKKYITGEIRVTYDVTIEEINKFIKFHDGYYDLIDYFSKYVKDNNIKYEFTPDDDYCNHSKFVYVFKDENFLDIDIYKDDLSLCVIHEKGIGSEYDILSDEPNVTKDYIIELIEKLK